MHCDFIYQQIDYRLVHQPINVNGNELQDINIWWLDLRAKNVRYIDNLQKINPLKSFDIIKYHKSSQISVLQMVSVVCQILSKLTFWKVDQISASTVQAATCCFPALMACRGDLLRRSVNKDESLQKRRPGIFGHEQAELQFKCIRRRNIPGHPHVPLCFVPLTVNLEP